MSGCPTTSAVAQPVLTLAQSLARVHRVRVRTRTATTRVIAASSPTRARRRRTMAPSSTRSTRPPGDVHQECAPETIPRDGAVCLPGAEGREPMTDRGAAGQRPEEDSVLAPVTVQRPDRDTRPGCGDDIVADAPRRAARGPTRTRQITAEDFLKSWRVSVKS
eukprot:918578-Prymnesium_polylepis.1